MRSIVVGMLAALAVFGVVELRSQEPTTPTTGDSAKGVPAMEEVEATGAGVTEDEAYRQAVVDAVRQVVGTLVSAENVVKNDRIIKDEVLTLSNGFVEKVLEREKTRQPDGSWEVRLKCIVRNGQVYGKLQKAKVPTIKFDGLSIFADVVSQLDHEESSVKIIENAFGKVTTDLVSATMVGEKPEIVERTEEYTSLSISWRASVDVDAFFKTCAPALDAALSSAATAKSKKPVKTPLKYSDDSGFLLATCVLDDVGEDLDREIRVAVPILQQKSSWGVVYYQIDKRILSKVSDPRPEEMVIVGQFCNSAGDKLLSVALAILELRKLEYGRRVVLEWHCFGDTIPYSVAPLLRPADTSGSWLASIMDRLPPSQRYEVANTTLPQWSEYQDSPYDRVYFGSSILNAKSEVSIPNSLLSKISSVVLRVESLSEITNNDQND